MSEKATLVEFAEALRSLELDVAAMLHRVEEIIAATQRGPSA